MQGDQSPLFQLVQLESKLLSRGYSRKPGEVFASCLDQIGYCEFLALIPSHNLLKFDPKGLTEMEVDKLAADVGNSLRQLNLEDQAYVNSQFVGKSG